ncbi:hypothetical protein GCM10028805_04880 [Spirosoma harenae]
MKTNPIENQVLYGLDSIDEKLTVEVSLKKLLLIYKTVEELISFFHQPDHYNNVGDLKQYLGNKETGMYLLLSRIYYEEFDKILPQNIKDIIEGDDFHSPILQYYKSK